MCGYCCGYRRDTYFGGSSYEDGTTIPVDEDDVCIYLEKLNIINTNSVSGFYMLKT